MDPLEEIKIKLQNRHCPLLDGDQSRWWIEELIFKSGEPHLNLLQWLLASLSIKITSCVIDSHSGLEALADVCVKQLGILSSNDKHLITASDSTAQRADFLCFLLDLLECQEETSVHQSNSFQSSSSMIPIGSSYSQTLNSDSNVRAVGKYIDAIVMNGSVQKSNTKIRMNIPVNLKAELKKFRSARGDGVTCTRYETIENRESLIQEIIMSNRESQDTFRKLESDLKAVPNIVSPTEEQNSKLRCVMQDLDEISQRFASSYQHEMALYHKQTASALSPIGPQCESLEMPLQRMVQTMDDVERLRHFCTTDIRNVQNEVVRIIQDSNLNIWSDYLGFDVYDMMNQTVAVAEKFVEMTKKRNSSLL